MSDCNHSRTMSLYLKHNDLAVLTIPHLNVERDDYLPKIGMFGGDDTQFTVCMDCGQIINWKAITDQEVNAALGIDQGEDDEEDLSYADRVAHTNAAEPALVVTADPKFEQEYQRMLSALRENCGAQWAADPDVQAFVHEQSHTGRSVYIRAAARRLMTCFE